MQPAPPPTRPLSPTGEAPTQALPAVREPLDGLEQLDGPAKLGGPETLDGPETLNEPADLDEPGEIAADPAPAKSAKRAASKRATERRAAQQAALDRLALDRMAEAGGSPWWWFAVPVGLLTGLITLLGSGREMWNDEYDTVYVTRLSRHDYLHLLHNQDIVHAVYYTLLRLWTEVFGDSLLSFRAPSMIAMAISAGGITILGRRLYSPALGLVAGLIFAGLPSVSRYGEEARSYAWVNAVTVLSTLALLWALDQPRSRLRWILYGASALALAYLHFAAAMVLLPHGLIAYYAWRRYRAGQLLRWTATAAAVTVIAAPLLLFASTQSGQVSWITNKLTDVRYYPGGLFGSDVLFWVIAVLAVAGALRMSQVRPEFVAPLLAWILVPPLFAYATNSVAHLFLAKYQLFTVPAWLMLVAFAFVPATGTKRRVLPASAVAAALVGVLVLTLAGLGDQFVARRSPLDGEPDFRGAAAVVDKGYKPGDGIVYVGVNRSARIPFMYELHKAKPTDVYEEVTSAQSGFFGGRDCADSVACLGKTARVWLVVTNNSDYNYTGLPDSEATPLENDYTETNTAQLTNIRVVLLVRNPGV